MAIGRLETFGDEDGVVSALVEVDAFAALGEGGGGVRGQGVVMAVTLG